MTTEGIFCNYANTSFLGLIDFNQLSSMAELSALSKDSIAFCSILLYSTR